MPVQIATVKRVCTVFSRRPSVVRARGQDIPARGERVEPRAKPPVMSSLLRRLVAGSATVISQGQARPRSAALAPAA